MHVYTTRGGGIEQRNASRAYGSGPVIPRPGYALGPQQGPGKTRYLLAAGARLYATHDIVRSDEETVRRADESFFLRRGFLEAGTA